MLSDLPDTVAPDARATVTAVLATVLETLVEKQEERVVLAGTAILLLAASGYRGVRQRRR